jgi:predicted NBD/HSP70 family sugar kinase
VFRARCKLATFQKDSRKTVAATDIAALASPIISSEPTSEGGTMGSPSALRKLNDRAALYALLDAGPLSQRELEAAIGVSRPAAAELLRRLEEVGLARVAGTRPGGRGPDARLWSIDERAAFAAGLDVNESSIDASVADLAGTTLAEGSVTIAPGEDPGAVVRKLLSTVARRAGLRRSDLRQLVVGISASVDPATGTLNHADHIPEWMGFDVRARLEDALGIPVSVENDVKLVLRDEAVRGQAVGCTDVLLLWMGRGPVTAIITGGRMLHGHHGSAGEIGYVPTGSDRALVGNILSIEGVLALAEQHGVAAADPDAAFAAQSTSFLDALAARIVDVIADPVAIIDPELVLLAGDIGLSGGDELAQRVADRLHHVLAHRPAVRTATGRENSVRQGALDASLRQLRETVFEDARNHREAIAE